MDQNRKFAFINIPSQELERPPAAAAAITGCLKSCGWDAKIFDFNLFLNNNTNSDEWSEFEKFWRNRSEKLSDNLRLQLKESLDLFFKYIDDHKPDVIGISVFTKFSIMPAWEIISYIKKTRNVKIMIGGHGAFLKTSSLPGLGTKEEKDTTFAELMKKEKLINYYVKGDGESPIMEFAKKYPNVKDVVGLNGNINLQLMELDEIPKPDYSEVDPKKYYYTKEPGVYITASRGCVRKCSFCNVPVLWPKFRSRSANHIVEEIVDIKDKFDVNLFHFTDSLLNGNMKVWRETNKKIIELKDSDPKYEPIKYMGQFICRRSVDQTEKDWEMMARAGAEILVTGFESFSPHVREHMGKNHTNEDIDFHIKQSAQHGIKNIALMFVGYPTETLEDHEYNKEFLYRYKDYAKAGIIHMVRWGYTGMFDQSSKINKNGDVNLIVDPEFEAKINDMSASVQSIARGFKWLNTENPTLNFKERIRRRIELHELSVKLGWPTTRSREELEILHNIIKNIHYNNISIDDLNDLNDSLDFH